MIDKDKSKEAAAFGLEAESLADLAAERKDKGKEPSPDLPFDVVYVNGDHTLNALRRPTEGWTAETIEPALRRLMFEGTEIENF